MKIAHINYILWKSLFRSHYLKTKKFVRESSTLDINHIKDYQDRCVKQIAKYCYNHIPFYSNFMKQNGLTPNDFTCTEDLEKFPILTKDKIKQDYKLFLPVGIKIPFLDSSTGGSTGVTLKYRISKESALYSSLLLDRGLGMGGYIPGDRLAIIAGGSLVGPKKPFKKVVIERMTNVRYFSSYGMDTSTLRKYVEQLIQFQPRFLRGYASALNSLGNFIEQNKLNKALNIKGIFSTSEVLTKNVRRNLEHIFFCKVYDGWGVNDGGASAFECDEQNGMHVDFERGLISIVYDDKEGFQPHGRIIVSTLKEKSMPLLRYDTGDLGRLDIAQCKCGCCRPRLFLGSGRVTDFIKVNEKIIGAPVLTVLMGKLAVKQYQIAKVSENALEIRIIKDADYSDKDEVFLLQSLQERIGNVAIKLKYVEMIVPHKDSKHKFIVDESSAI